MEKKDVMQLAYDHDADILYLSVGKPRRTISREIGNDVLLRVDAETGAIVGLTILNLSTHDTLEDLPVVVDWQELG